MKPGDDGLAACPQQVLAPIYLITGEELLLREEAATAIRRAARKQGYAEREYFSVPGTGGKGSVVMDWDAVRSATENLSLFGGKKLVELHVDKIGKEVRALLEGYRPCAAMILLITVEKLNAEFKKSVCFKRMAERGAVVEIPPVKGVKSVSWLRARLRQAGFMPDEALVYYLAAAVEGNLSAAKQEIDKLVLSFAPGKLTLEEVRQSLGDHARLDVFRLADAVVAGDIGRCLSVSRQLRRQGTEATLVLWALARETRLLLEFAERGDGAVWPSRKAAYRKRAQVCGVAKLSRLLQQAHRIDRAIKGVGKDPVWPALDRLGAALCT